MPFYSDELVEEVRSANNIVDVIGGYVSLKKKGSTYFGLCPFHNEKTGSFSVSPNKQMYYCFGCGAGGNVFTFLREYENFTFQESMEVLAERAGITLPKQEMSEKQKAEADKRQQMLDLNKTAATYYYAQLRKPQGQHGMDYFKKRGLSDETLKKFGLGYSNKYSDDLYQFLKQKGASDELMRDAGLVSLDERRGAYDKFFNRVMFPIMDVHNHVIGFGGRVMGDGEPKYLNSPETMVFDKSRNLYGLNLARTTRKNYYLLCEGYMDVISLHQAGFDNAVASLGTALTEGHANLLKRYTKEVYITYDSDGAGQKAALRAIPILRAAGISTKVINMTPHKDPDEFIKALGAEEYEKRINDAENSFIFEIRVLQSNYDMSDPGKKTEFQEALADRLLEFTEELERQNYLEACANRFHINRDSLEKLVMARSQKLDRTVKKKEPLKTGRNDRKQREDGAIQSQKLLLTYLIEYPEIYGEVKKWVEPTDFTEELFFKVANMVYEGLHNNNLNPAQIISLFPLEEEQRAVAGLFNTSISNIETKDDLIRAIRDTVLKVKQNSLNKKTDELDPSDMETMMKLVTEKKLLAGIANMPITLNTEE